MNNLPDDLLWHLLCYLISNGRYDEFIILSMTSKRIRDIAKSLSKNNIKSINKIIPKKLKYTTND